MTKREFLDTVFALAPNEANAIMDAFDEYVESAQLGTNLAEVGTDCISRQQAIDALVGITMFKTKHELMQRVNASVQDEQGWLGAVAECLDEIEDLPSAQPERTCVNCGKTINNGGWYADGRTRCPIEEHYALPKDGFCHLWEKRNITDDDYPERREDEH